MSIVCNSVQAKETSTDTSVKRAKTVITPAAPDAKAVKKLSNSAPRTAVTNTPPVLLPKLLDLGAKKCIPCKKLAPILDELEKEYAGVFTVEFIDVWLPENKGKAEKHGVGTIPTQIFFDPQGKELGRHVGFISKKDILAQWKKYGYKFKPKIFPVESLKKTP